jgi:hypothetical protein
MERERESGCAARRSVHDGLPWVQDLTRLGAIKLRRKEPSVQWRRRVPPEALDASNGLGHPQPNALGTVARCAGNMTRKSQPSEALDASHGLGHPQPNALGIAARSGGSMTRKSRNRWEWSGGQTRTAMTAAGDDPMLTECEQDEDVLGTTPDAGRTADGQSEPGDPA